MTNTIVKTFCCQLFIVTSIFSQEFFFNELERQLRYKEEQAISSIVYAADKVPQPECLKLLKCIEDRRNIIKATLFCNREQQYFWVPRDDTVTPTVVENNDDITMGKVALYTAQYANMLGLKPGVIRTAYKSSPEKDNKIFAYVKATDLKSNCYKIHFCIDWFNKQNKVYFHAGHTILHELTHIIEGHPLVEDLIISTIKPYYTKNGFTIEIIKKIEDLVLIHETIAAIAPLMWSHKISSIQKVLHHACQMGIFECQSIDKLHLTFAERFVFNALIYEQHENKSIQDLFSIANKMPLLKRAFLMKSAIYFASFPLGLGLGMCLSAKI